MCLIIREIVNLKDFEESEVDIELYVPMDKLKHPKVYDYDSDFPIVINSDDLTERQTNDLRVQSMFKPPRHNNASIFLISLRLLRNTETDY